MRFILISALVCLVSLSACSDDGASYPTPCGQYSAVRGGRVKDQCTRVFAPENGFVRLPDDETNGQKQIDVPPGGFYEVVSCYPESQTGPVKFGECSGSN